jgi:hypothetical protein
MKNRECLVLIARFLSETHPVAASLISRSTYTDPCVRNNLARWKRLCMYDECVPGTWVRISVNEKRLQGRVIKNTASKEWYFYVGDNLLPTFIVNFVDSTIQCGGHSQLHVVKYMSTKVPVRSWFNSILEAVREVRYLQIKY